MKTHLVRVTYKTQLTHEEYRGLVKLGRIWGYDFDNAKPLKIVKRVLQNCGTSGALGALTKATEEKHEAKDF